MMRAVAALVTGTSDADFVEFVLAFVFAVTMFIIILRVLLIQSSTSFEEYYKFWP